MNPRLLELAERQGALKARITMQREALGLHAQPLAEALAGADRALLGVAWLKAHPAVVGVAILGVTLLRPKFVWQWGKRSFFVWRSWKSLRQRLRIS